MKVKMYFIAMGFVIGILSTLGGILMYQNSFLDQKTPSPLGDQFSIFAYYPSWKKDSFPIQKVPIASFQGIMHAFVWPDKNGNLYIPEDFDSSALQALQGTGALPMISIGGSSNSYGFKKLANHPDVRERFVQDLVTFMREHGYRGVDIDWEYPRGNYGTKALISLAENIRKEMPDAIITTALPITPSWQRINVAELHGSFDRIFVMSYDIEGGWAGYGGHNAPLYKNESMPQDMSIITLLQNEFIDKGVPREKLVLGIAVYGRKFETANPYEKSENSEIVEYKDLPFGECIERYDYVSRVPFLSCDGYYISYDNTESIAEKIRFAKEKGLGGVFFWALGQDNGKIISEFFLSNKS